MSKVDYVAGTCAINLLDLFLFRGDSIKSFWTITDRADNATFTNQKGNRSAFFDGCEEDLAPSFAEFSSEINNVMLSEIAASKE